jgi:hypothetical protein
MRILIRDRDINSLVVTAQILPHATLQQTREHISDESGEWYDREAGIRYRPGSVLHEFEFA